MIYLLDIVEALFMGMIVTVFCTVVNTPPSITLTFACATIGVILFSRRI